MGLTKDILKKYKVAHENEHGFVIQHEDGSHFKVAKAGISHEMQEHLKKMCMGDYADGGDVKAPATPQQAQDVSKDFNSQTWDRPSPSPSPSPQPVQKFDDGGEVEEAPEEDNAPVNDLSGVLRQSPALQQEVGQNVPLPQDTLQNVEDTLTQQQQAASDLGKAKGQLGTEQAATYGEQAKTFQDLAVDYNKSQKDKDTRDAALAQAMLTHIDPDRYVKSLGIGQKVLTGASILLGQLFAPATGGRNVGLDAFNHAVNQDIATQKEVPEGAKTLYQMSRERAADKQIAETDYKNSVLTLIQAKLQRDSASIQDPMQRAIVQNQVAQIEQQKQMLKQQNQVRMINYGIQNGAVDKSLLGLFPEKQKTAILLPDNQSSIQAVTPQAAQEANAKIDGARQITDILNKIDALRSATDLLPSQQRDRVAALASAGRVKLAQLAGTKRYSPEMLKSFGEQFNNPNELLDQLKGQAKSDELRGILKDDVDSTLAKSSIAYKSKGAVPGGVVPTQRKRSQ